MNISPPIIITKIPCLSCGQLTAVKPELLHHASRHGITCLDCMPSKQMEKWTPETYQDYLQSNHWKQFKARALAHYGRKCYLCGTEGAVDLHHNTYERVGGELLSDVIPLCRDCHQGYEDWRKAREL